MYVGLLQHLAGHISLDHLIAVVDEYLSKSSQMECTVCIDPLMTETK